MEKMIAFCGLDCFKCPAFLATKNDSDEQRKEVADLWSKQHQVEITPESINCEGCLSNGILFGHCQVCEIRKCAQEKGVENCAHCSDYACGKLEPIFQMMPEAKNNLDFIKKNI